MKFLAYFFKFLFKFKPFEKYYFSFYKRLFKPYSLFRGIRTQTRYDRDFKIEVEVEEWIQQHIFFFGVYDAPSIKYIKKLLNPEDVFIDIGANIGTYSISATAALDAKQGGMVYAFEPVNSIYQKLTRNIALNGIENIVTHKLALFEENTTLDLFVSSSENLGMSSIFHHDTESGEVEKVKAIKLDDFIEENKIKHVKLIKIDIEGAELFALKGMLETIRKFKPTLLIEISENVLEGNGIKSIEIFKFMKGLNYLPYTLDETGKLLPMETTSDKKITNYVFVYNEG